MPLLFEVVETENVYRESKGELITYRLLKNSESWGVDCTATMSPIFGYSEEGARNTYDKIKS